MPYVIEAKDKERFLSKIESTSIECNKWIGTKSPAGAPQFKLNGKTHSAQAVLYQIKHDITLDKGTRIKTSCGEKHCMNADHLIGPNDTAEPSTQPKPEPILPNPLKEPKPTLTVAESKPKPNHTAKINLLTGEGIDPAIVERVKENFANVRRSVHDCMQGRWNALIVSGSGGVGKSHDVKEALEEIDQWNQIRFGDSQYHVYKGKLNESSLYQVLHKHSNTGAVLVFDDSDAIFASNSNGIGMLNMAKAAMGDEKVRRVSYGGNSFDYRGTVIFITNDDLQGRSDRSPSKSPHYAAAFDRVHHVDIGCFNVEERMARIHYVLKNSKFLETNELSNEEAEDILTYIVEVADKIKDISLRTIKQATAIYKSFVRPDGSVNEQWKKDILIRMGRKSKR